MRRVLQMCVAAVVATGTVAAFADNIAVPLPPSGPNATPVGYDDDPLHGSVVPTGGAGAPVGFGDQSMTANLSAGQYSTLRVFVGGPGGLFTNGNVTLDQLGGITYQTNQYDGYAIIYTTNTAGANAHGWYDQRLLGVATSGATTVWTTHSSTDATLLFDDTSAKTDPLTFSPTNALSIYTGEAGAANEAIEFIDFKIGATTTTGPITGQLDAISLNIGGVTKTLDLAATPLPSSATMGLGVLGLAGAAAFLRRKPKAV